MKLSAAAFQQIHPKQYQRTFLEVSIRYVGYTTAAAAAGVAAAAAVFFCRMRPTKQACNSFAAHLAHIIGCRLFVLFLLL
jgi:Mn2+/Fe2+ NRAMP family transporter